MEDIDEDSVLPGPFQPVGDTTGVLVLPNFDPDEVKRIDFDVPEAEGFEDGEVLKVYFEMHDNNVGYRYYRIDEEFRSFVDSDMKNLSILPPEAVEGMGEDEGSE